LLTLAAWCGFLFFYGLTTTFYRTESRRAVVGQAALDGHWLTPTLHGEPFLTKPPGIYVGMGLMSLPYGRVTEATARLPSALAATLAVLLAYCTLRRFLGDRAAFVAAVLLPVSGQWLDKAPSAEIEMLHLATVAAAIFAFLRAMEAEPGSRLARWWGLAAMVCVAIGFLVKWPAPSFFYLAVIPFLIWHRRLHWLVSPEHLIGVALAVVVWSAWAALVTFEVGWDVLRDTVSNEAALRFGRRTDMPYPWTESFLFPIQVIGANLPWSIPALLALRPSFLRKLSERDRLVVSLLHCWAWPSLLFWTLPKMHAVRYVFPICPAITVLGVIVILHWADAAGPGRRKAMWAVLVCSLAAFAAAKVVFVEAIVPGRLAQRHGKATGEEIARLVPADAILYIWRLRDDQVLFYSGRDTRRIELPAASIERPQYVLLRDEEWRARTFRGRPEYLAELRSDVNEPIHLVRLIPEP
jgi:4-amino-4-deoxy-L-arabinose transferase-like glycosyltransferase